MTPPPRKKRPKPERDRPVRSWSTLFGANAARSGAGPSSSPAGSNGDAKRDTSGAARALTDTVGLGYRVVDEYLRQGQQVAQGFNPGGFAGPSSQPDDLSQMQQRLMQYGWDFAGLWFEMWSKMSGGMTPPAPFGQRPPESPGSAGAAEQAAARDAEADAQSAQGARSRVVVFVTCQRPTTTALEVRSGSSNTLVVHALRAEGHEAAPIRDIGVECAADGTVTVRVVIGADQPAGIYNAMIVDAATNLPRGTLSVVIAEGQA